MNKRDEVIKSLQYGIDGKIKMVNDLVRIRSENEENISNLGNKLGVQTNVIKALKEKMKLETLISENKVLKCKLGTLNPN